ncbi:hypothetical protein ABQD61_00185 [Enterococcus asini]
MDVTIRRYHAGDKVGIWQLNTQVLGYPFAYEETAAKLALLAENPEHCILIAQVDGEVVGYIFMAMIMKCFTCLLIRIFWLWQWPKTTSIKA